MKRLIVSALLLVAAVELEARVVGGCQRDPGDVALSGITRGADGTFWAADDNGMIVQGRIEFKDGVPLNWKTVDRFKCDGVNDPEGIVFDKLDGTLWVANERGPEIFHVDPKTKSVLGRVDVPQIYRTAEENRGFESLAIANDGLTLWTANEDVLPGDQGSGCVRLQRFSRVSVTNVWKTSGQWAYRLTPGSDQKKNKSRNGLAELCVTPDGNLIALEREKYKGKKAPSKFRLRIFKVELDGATDVATHSPLRFGEFTPVRKIQLCDMPTWNAMFEAVCVGPKLEDGTDSYVLVSDGDKGCDEKVMVLTLP